MSGTESVVTAPPQSAPANIKTLSQKFEYAKQLEGEVQRRIQDWVNALGKEIVTSLIFKHFKAKVLETHGQEFNLQHFFGNINTNSRATSYIAHIVKYLPRLCTITGEGASEDVSISEPSVKARVEKIVAFTKDSIQVGHISNTISCLLQYDLFIPVLEATASEVAELEALHKNAEQRTAQSAPPGFVPASPSLVDLELGEEDQNEEEEWEDTEDRGGYGSANLTGIYQSTLVEHEESGDFDPTAILRAQNYVAEIGNRTEEVAGHEGDLSNEDFIQTVKINRMNKGDRSKFSDREIREATRQITQLLERLCLDISHLSVKGLDRPEKETVDNKDPFILVRVKSESEARAILEKAVFVIDDHRYVASPKSNRLVRFNVSFVAAAANLQVSTDRIVRFLNGTVLSEFVSRIVYVQSFSEDIRGGTRFVRRFYAILRPPLGPSFEPAVLDPKNPEHSAYFIPTQYVFDPMGIVYIKQCSAWECRKCFPLNQRYGHQSSICDSQTKGKGKGKGRGRGEGLDSSAGISGTGSRGAASARWEQNRARAAKRKSEPTSQSPAYKHASGTERREEIATAARRGGADISDRF
ncbi:hypothetical protein CYMTET_21855 [Cymbomonas tetramitiformis]|uniref:Uncharacterized protein n=1 Tax=Cymbomonas tetramitiformis TaxID=36881 RepID=A0AAE0G174_9CHLO|nr:hypothetical protein CYMTET_21855 [Cymbomonas tetramitiformis]